MWDERYGEAGWAYGLEPNAFLVSVLARIRIQGDVLCLGAGEGRNAVWLAERGCRVVALDQSAVGLDKAARLAASRRVDLETVCADVATSDLGEARWDAVVSIYCHLPKPVRARVHGALSTALRPGGAYVLEAYAPGQLAFDTGGPKDPDMLYELGEVEAELAGLYHPIARRVTRGVFEGRYHTGASSVVQVVATR